MKKKTDRPRMYALTGANIQQHLEYAQAAERATHSHFRLYSLFVKALAEHVRTASDADCVVDREGRSVSCHRGTGYAIELKDPILHFALPGETKMLSFKLHVGYEPLDDDPERDSLGNRDVERVYRLYIPIDLELNYTQEKFNLWAKKMKSELDAEKLEKERAQLDRLLARHQDYAILKLLKTKPSASSRTKRST